MHTKNLASWKRNPENGYYRLNTSGLFRNVLSSNCGYQRVAIALWQEGVIAWKAVGSELHNDFVARIIAIWLLLKGIHNKDVIVFVLSAYAAAGNH